VGRAARHVFTREADSRIADCTVHRVAAGRVTPLQLPSHHTGVWELVLSYRSVLRWIESVAPQHSAVLHPASQSMVAMVAR
jgi:hypothetical protein